MTNRTFSRRAVLRSGLTLGGAAGLTAWLPGWAQPVSRGFTSPDRAASDNDIVLHIARQTMIIDGRATHAIGINGSVPGPLIRLGVIIAVAYYALLSQVTAPWQIYPIQILSAAMIAIVSGIAITFFQSYIPNQPGTATNIYTNANRIGSTVGYLCYGSLVTSLGHRAVFLVCTGVCAAAFLLLWLSREKHESEAPAGG